MGLSHEFRDDEHGADLVEYSLLVAFMAVASVALFLASGESVGGLWLAVNRVLTQAFDGAGGKTHGS